MSRLLWLRVKALLPWSRFEAHQLGALYAAGDSLPKDERRALRWYRRGARRGDPECAYDLGFMLLLGEGTAPDLEEASYWLKRAVAGRHADAARLLSDVHLGNFGHPVDEEEAERWLTEYERLRAGI